MQPEFSPEISSESGTNTTPDALAKRWAELKAEHDHLRIRDAAQQLGVAEVQLLATQCGKEATRLTGSWPDLLVLVSDVKVNAMALTRNDACVIELSGRYPKPEVHGESGLAIGNPIDLRFFFKHWEKAFALSEVMRGKLRHSLLFFDASGEAVHKIYFLDEELGGREPFERLIAPFIAANQGKSEVIKPLFAETTEPDFSQHENFLEAWGNMEGPHDFASLLSAFNIDRLSAVQWAEGTYVDRVPNDSFRKLLNDAKEKELPIMVFVGNPGCLQIYSGTVKHIADRGPWFNVLDPHFNLHLMEPMIHSCWRVNKPLGKDSVHALELYSESGLHILTMYGKRKPGEQELPQWRESILSIRADS